MPSIFVPFDSSCNFTLENDVLRFKNTNIKRGLDKNQRTLSPIGFKILVKLSFLSYLQNQNSNELDFGIIRFLVQFYIRKWCSQIQKYKHLELLIKKLTNPTRIGTKILVKLSFTSYLKNQDYNEFDFCAIRFLVIFYVRKLCS